MRHFYAILIAAFTKWWIDFPNFTKMNMQNISPFKKNSVVIIFTEDLHLSRKHFRYAFISSIKIMLFKKAKKISNFFKFAEYYLSLYTLLKNSQESRFIRYPPKPKFKLNIDPPPPPTKKWTIIWTLLQKSLTSNWWTNYQITFRLNKLAIS